MFVPEIGMEAFGVCFQLWSFIWQYWWKDSIYKTPNLNKDMDLHIRNYHMQIFRDTLHSPMFVILQISTLYKAKSWS